VTDKNKDMQLQLEHYKNKFKENGNENEKIITIIIKMRYKIYLEDLNKLPCLGLPKRDKVFRL